jgi:uncharacterized protein YggE
MRTISVVGSGEVAAKPDMAEIQLGVTTQAQTAAEALKANSEAMSRLLKALAARGVAEKDVQTTNLSVAPQYRHEPPGREAVVSGYMASNQVKVKVRQLDSLGAVVDEAVGQGANQVHGIQFRSSAEKPLMDQARRDAVEDAKRRAELYAAAAGVKVGKVITIQEQGGRFPQPQMTMLRGAAMSAPVAAGELEFEASVSVTYAIE